MSAPRRRVTFSPTGWRWRWWWPRSAGIYWLLRTKRGLALAAVRDNMEAAKSVGVDAARMKWTVFLIAAFGTGLAGGLIFLQNGRISPDSAFSVIDWTAFVIFIVVIGGIGTIEGPIIGVLVFFALQTLFADYGSWYLIALGGMGIVIMLFAPRGLWGLISDKSGIQLFPIRRRLSGGRIDGQTSTPRGGIIMADISTDVLIIGTGPAGSATAALLSSYGVENMVVNRYRWLANTPRAHITNQRTMEVLRDLGPEVEAEAYMHCTEQDLMGENVFCESLAGEEIGRMKSWGSHPLSRAEHHLSSPTMMNDLPQTLMEPLLFKTACFARHPGADVDGVQIPYARCRRGDDDLSRPAPDPGRDITIRSKIPHRRRRRQFQGGRGSGPALRGARWASADR